MENLPVPDRGVWCGQLPEHILFSLGNRCGRTWIQWSDCMKTRLLFLCLLFGCSGLIMGVITGCQPAPNQKAVLMTTPGSYAPARNPIPDPDLHLVSSLYSHKRTTTENWNRLEKLTQTTVHHDFLRAAAKSMQTAYPEWIKGYGKNALYWKDSTATRWNYRISTLHFHILMSMGRLRMESVFRKMYGNSSQEVQSQFTTVHWLPNTLNQKIKFSTTNGAANALQEVSNALDTLPQFKKYLTPLGGTFNWRTISGTNMMSPHAFSIAIDINTKYADYWRWSPEFKADKPLKYRNRIPMEIVEVFEAHGFVWGGRWPHYDTMHFEYRPEVKLYNDWFAQSDYKRYDQ